MNKIKKLYPLIVGVVLLVSVAAYGTRAYFSDSTTEQVGIDLEMGSVRVEDTSNNWSYTSETVEKNLNLLNKNESLDVNPLEKDVRLTNVRPGDSFEKTFTFTNTGSLDQIVTFGYVDAGDKEVEVPTDNIFDIKWVKDNTPTEVDVKQINTLKETTLIPGKTVKVKMIVSIPLNITTGIKFDESGANASKPTLNVNKFVGNTIKVEAVQTNANVAITGN